MTINYTWKITSLTISEEPQPETVVLIDGYLYGQDADGFNSTESFVVTLPPPSENFTPYNQLTEQQVQNWIESVLPDKHKAEYKARLDAKIEAIKNPTNPALPANPSLPWGGQVQHTVFYEAPDA
jgi:hypothetical protein